MGKNVLVTGAGRGLGTVLAKELTKRGDHVIAHARSQEALRDVPHETSFIADLNEPESLAEAVESTDFGALDVIIHNAGVATVAGVAELDVETWQRHMNVNVTSPAELTRLLLPQLRRNHGHVLFVNSGAGLSTGPRWGAYAASKHAMRSLADALRGEERANGVQVTSVFPSHFDTDMQRYVREAMDSDYETSRASSPTSVAEYLASFIHRPHDAVINEVRIEPPNPLPIKPRS